MCCRHPAAEAVSFNAQSVRELANLLEPRLRVRVAANNRACWHPTPGTCTATTNWSAASTSSLTLATARCRTTESGWRKWRNLSPRTEAISPNRRASGQFAHSSTPTSRTNRNDARFRSDRARIAVQSQTKQRCRQRGDVANPHQSISAWRFGFWQVLDPSSGHGPAHFNS